jgi:hypothetical protein
MRVALNLYKIQRSASTPVVPLRDSDSSELLLRVFTCAVVVPLSRKNAAWSYSVTPNKSVEPEYNPNVFQSYGVNHKTKTDLSPQRKQFQHCPLRESLRTIWYATSLSIFRRGRCDFLR